MKKVANDTAIKSYRDSHSSQGYGERYSQTYTDGYYAHQWRLIERPLLREILANLKHTDNCKFMDFACGTGRILSVGEEFYNDTTGVDVSEEMLRYARKNCKKSRIINQDITKTNIDGQYDVITAFRFFLNAEPELACDVLTSLHELLNSDGIFIMNIHVNRYSPLGIFYRLRNVILNKSQSTKSLGEIKKILQLNGFAVEEVYRYSFLPRTGWLFGSVAKYAIVPLDNIVEFVPFFKVLSQSFLLVCVKK